MVRRVLPVVLPLVMACSAASRSTDDAPGPGPDAESPLAPGPDAAAPLPAGPYFPPAGDSWESVDHATSGFDAARLDELVRFVGDSSSTTFMILFDGRIVVEKYWGANASTLRDVASVQKSIVSLLVGVAVAEGAFGLDDTVTSLVGAGWSNGSEADEAPITVRQLLTMTSGLDDSLERVAAPGTAWLYNTDAYHRLEGIIEAKTGQSLQDVTRSRLFDPIGAGPSAWTKRRFQKDAKGAPMSALEMTARDMARVGLTVMADGGWSGKTLVPRAYLAAALSTSQPLNPSYGLLFWLNGKDSALMPPSKPKAGMLIPSAPADVVAALGAGDQKIYASRSTRLVVVRQGESSGVRSLAGSVFDDELWKRIMAARLP